MNVPSNHIGDLIRFYTKELSSMYSLEEARSMIEIILEHFFSVNKLKLVLNPELRLNETELLKLHFAVRELKNYKPVQYITNQCIFDGNSFYVDSNVLIPRPETEELVLHCSGFLSSSLSTRVLDIGTGSGCIAVSLARRFPESEIHAVDVSANALEIAKRNALHNRAAIRFHQADILIDTLEVESHSFGLIVSNPPYVTNREKFQMHSNVLNFEPHLALFVPDDDPLLFYRQICHISTGLLMPGGMLALEINENFGDDLAELLRSTGFIKVIVHKDIHKKDRFVTGLRLC